MRQSQLFTKTRKETPADETSTNAILLARAGYVYKEMAGAYDYLPLGLKVLANIQQIIREEINAIGGQEMLLTSLQEKELWEKTGRWNDEEVDVWFKTKLKNDTELGLAATHEEPITRLVSQYVRSYADLPFSAYQFQTKFRNETRAKSGILRTREFIMKDLYSFHADEADLDRFYEKAAAAYEKIFQRVGIGHLTYKTFASGGMFSAYSHEFQTLCEAGEDSIHIHPEKKIAINKEVFTDDVLADLGVNRGDLQEKKSIEVGNIFKLGTRFSEPLGLSYTTENGEEKPVIMGCYGIGPGRLMGTIVEALSDDKGIVWPKEIAPFHAHLVRLGDTAETVAAADNLYAALTAAGMDILYDDRPGVRPGEKFADADLLGMPVRLVISDKTVADGKVEVKLRTETAARMVGTESVHEEIL